MRLLHQILRYSVQQTHRHSKHLQETSGKKCLEPCTVPTKKSIWRIFGRKSEPKPCLDKKVVEKKECETVEFVTDKQADCDIETISKTGGKVLKTCGTAYIVQTDYYQANPEATSNKEEEILEEMVKDPSLKGQRDPMPPFESVELRMIALNEHKLHPLYKKLMSIPKKPIAKAGAVTTKYQTRSGPILPEEFPPQLKIKKEDLDRKNIFYEFKKAEPPMQMMARMVEMKYNERPKLRLPQKKDCSKK